MGLINFLVAKIKSERVTEKKEMTKSNFLPYFAWSQEQLCLFQTLSNI